MWQRFLLGDDFSGELATEWAGVPEGRLLQRLHFIRERNPQIVREKKELVLRDTGRLACEACSFDFFEAYGEIGRDFAECHHRRPLSETGPSTRTTVDDLAVICANCHRMLHVGKTCRTVEELRAVLTERERL